MSLGCPEPVDGQRTLDDWMQGSEEQLCAGKNDQEVHGVAQTPIMTLWNYHCPCLRWTRSTLCR
jgi:hypothetical protein